jgi:hypothetical protein
MSELLDAITAISKRFGNNVNLIICCDDGYNVVKDRSTGKVLLDFDSVYELSDWIVKNK